MYKLPSSFIIFVIVNPVWYGLRQKAWACPYFTLLFVKAVKCQACQVSQVLGVQFVKFIKCHVSRVLIDAILWNLSRDMCQSFQMFQVCQVSSVGQH